jgi:hypothetical protein
MGDDVCERRFPKPWWAKEQDMIQGLLAIARSSNKNLQLLAHALLADVFLEGSGA